MEKRDLEEEERLIASSSRHPRRGSCPLLSEESKERARSAERDTTGYGERSWAVLGCFVAWTISNPRRSLAFVACALGIIALTLFKLIYHPPAPPSPWRAQCRPDFPTHYAFHRPTPQLVDFPPGSNHLPPLHHPDHSAYPDHPDHHKHPSHPHGPRRSSEDMENRQVIHSIQPLTSVSPAWPYSSPEPPSLAQADRFAPVGVYLGVFTMDSEDKRRHMIRNTYGSHRESRTRGTEGVEVRFVMGRPKENYAAAVALEQEVFGDLVILDIEENMNEGKTHAFFTWASQNARVPDCRYDTPHGSPVDEADTWDKRDSVMCEGSRQPDYVVKADDDSFIMLGELEKRLRIIPREKAYWGRESSSQLSSKVLMYGQYLQFAERSEYMAGEGYALSMDLVNFVANSPYAMAHTHGDEDQRVGDWLRAHPEAETIVWVTDHCWMYDHPKAGKVLSHGFMFPDVVHSIRTDSHAYLPTSLPAYLQDQWSTVSPYKRKYKAPTSNLSISQQLEAMTEGSPLSMLHRHNRPYNPSFPSDEESMAMDVERAWRARPSREERMRGAEHGSTVLIHKVRKDEWWMETALALLGPDDSSEPDNVTGRVNSWPGRLE